MPVSGIEAYHRPPDVDSAWRLLRDGGEAVRLLAGGSDLVVACPPQVTTLVDLADAGLQGIEAGPDGSLTVGAMTTFTDLLEDEAARAYGRGVLHDVVAGFGSVLHRNHGTIGGHLARARVSDVVPALLVLDATVEVRTDEVTERPLREYLDGPRTPHVLTAVRLPAVATSAAAAFTRFSRAGFDHSLVNAATYVRTEDGSPTGPVADCRIAVGEAGTLGRRLPEAEATLRGRPLDAGTVELVGEAVTDTVEVRERGSTGPDYRRHLSGVLVTRCLELVSARLQGGAA
jgi:aerobic carbon-monoxide dehydrogenase medium subunit